MPNDEARTPTPDEVRKIADILSSYSVSSTGLDHYVAQLRQLADQLERNAEVQWQPIETAPKDNALKLLVLIDGSPGIWYRDAYYEPGGRGYVPGLSGWVNEEGVERYDSPTHWMPLPKPPEAK